MDERLVETLRTRLAGRTKRDLIEGMVTRSPHPAATEKLVQGLEVFPLLILMLAHDYPTKVWLLDKGEKPSSAEIFTERMKRRRWHSTGITIDDCDGVTDLAPGYIGIAVSWKTLFILRHEFGHAVTTFLPPRQRQHLGALYQQATVSGVFTEPLAGESIAEYAACGLSYYFFPDLRSELATTDPGLHRLVDGFYQKAETLSANILAPVALRA